MEKISVEKLQELSIFEIRNLAREVGVYSPTTLKKGELVEKIMRIMDGLDEPYIKKTKQGRPPKSITSINNLVDVIVPSKIFVEKKNINEKTFFCDLNESINVNVIGTNETNFKALVKVYNDGEYALAFVFGFNEEQDSVVFIAKTQVEFYNLKTGDRISGKYAKVTEDKPFVLKEIYSINELNFSEGFVRGEDFNCLQALSPCKKLKMSIYKINDNIYNLLDLVSPLACGQRVILNSCTLNNSLNYQILNRLTTSTNNINGLAVLIDEMPENYYEIKNNNRLDTLSNNYNNVNNNFKLELEVRLENLKRRVENGEDVILFVNDIDKLFNYIVNLYILEDVNKENAKIFAEDYIKSLILLGKFTKNGGSFTVVCGTLNKNNNFINLFNNIICYKKQGLEFVLDIDNCNTYNIENILTKQELNKLIELNKK